MIDERLVYVNRVYSCAMHVQHTLSVVRCRANEMVYMLAINKHILEFKAIVSNSFDLDMAYNAAANLVNNILDNIEALIDSAGMQNDFESTTKLRLLMYAQKLMLPLEDA